MIRAPAVDEALLARLLAGDRGALARAISTVERGGAEAHALLDRVHGHTGRAWRVGVTGPPGAGKSTLTGALVRLLRERQATVGIVAVDPTSPFTRGAVLGDRVRMGGVANDPGVYIRSMATRGSTGGLSRAAADAADLIDAAGYHYVFVETAGVGQTELEIAGAADTTVLVLVPEGGDFVQALKAGIMEIADVYVLNKSDRPGAGEALQAIGSMLRAQPRAAQAWQRPLCEAAAGQGRGIGETLAAIDAHRHWLHTGGRLRARRAAHLQHRVQALVGDMIAAQVWDAERRAELDARREDLIARRVAPLRVAQQIVAGYHRALRTSDPGAGETPPEPQSAATEAGRRSPPPR